MARIDSLLSNVVAQNANELRVGTDREPRIFAFGAPLAIHLPETSEETLRDLLGEIFTPEREDTMRKRGRVEVAYAAKESGPFQVTLYAREHGFDVVFLRRAIIEGHGSRDPRSSGRMPNATAVGLAPPRPPDPPPAPAVEPAVRPPRAGAPLAPKPGDTLEAFAEMELPRAKAVIEFADGAKDLGAPRAAAMPRSPPASEGLEQLPDPILPHAPASAVTFVSTEDRSPLARLVGAAALLRASDLHLADGEPPYTRVDGVLQCLESDVEIHVAHVLALEPAEQERLTVTGSLDLGREIAGVGRVRLHVYRTSTGVAAAMRLVPRAAPALASLRMPIALEDLVGLANGLVIVCGATGSGKSTTLASLAQEALRTRSVMVTTLEDPIEHALHAPKGSIVRRRQIGRDAPDFATGLRDALREDPDILLVGELRGPETISLTLMAAQTGRLVLASTHSQSAASAVEDLIDAYPPERQGQTRLRLAASLRAIVAQRLLPRAHGRGRVVAIEVLRATQAVSALIREGKTAQLATAIQSGKKEGMIALERSLADRVVAGEVTLEHAQAAANDGETLARYLRK